MSHLERLTENRLERKRNAVKGEFGHLSGVRNTSKPTKTREPRSQLQAVFLKRVHEAMKAQGLIHDDGRPNGTKLSKRHGAPSQTTINDVLRGADPRLETVQAFATALELAPVSLLTEQKLPGNIHNLPGIPTISGRIDKAAANKARDRNKGRG